MGRSGAAARLLVAIVGLLVTSCGSEIVVGPHAGSVGQSDSAPVEDGSTPASVPWWQAARRPAERLQGPETTVSWTTKPLDLIAALAQAVVSGEVLGVDGPFWNEADGQYWEQVSADMTVPMLYREVAFRVDSVLYDSTGSLRPGTEISLLVLGGGGSQPRVGAGATEGVVLHPGDEQMLFLAYMAFDFRENFVDTWQPLLPPVSVLDNIAGRYRPQWVGQGAEVFALVPQLAQDDFSSEELSYLIDAVKAGPLPADFRGLLPSNFSAERRRLDFGIETAEPACLNVTRGECS
jgi:hypothetical protein